MGCKYRALRVSALPLLAVFCSALAFSGAASAQSCPIELFRIGPGANLPDCRAYERASPADKNGGAVEGFPDLLTTSIDGSSSTFFSQAGTGIPAEGGAMQDYSTYLSSRGSETWSTQRVSPPQSFGQRAHFLGTTPDQQFAFVEASQEGSGPSAGRGLFLIDTSSKSIETLVPNGANLEGAPEYSNFQYRYAIDGASTDGSRVLFETRAQLTTDAGPEVDNLYLWSRATGAVTLAGVLPGPIGQAPPGGSFGGAPEWYFESDLSQGGALYDLAVAAVNAVTSDASQVFFTAGETGQLYLRRGLTGPGPETIPISQPNPGVADPNGEKPSAFQEATPDGTQAFFLSSGKLTSDATTGASDEGRDLYKWSSATGKLTDLTVDAQDELGAQVQGLLGVSDDGASGYFVARGNLAAGAQLGAENLYRFETVNGSETFEFIATLESGSPESRLPDVRNWSPITYLRRRVFTESFTRTSRVSSDGRTLLFSSVRPLTGYDNENPIGSECFNGRCQEIFRYSVASGSQTGKLDCISCDPNGAPPVGSALLQSDLLNGGIVLPRSTPLVTFPSNLSDDGSRVFFESPDALVGADTNGASECPGRVFNELPSCLDVYEWEAEGDINGSCPAAEISGGCLHLISTGKSQDPSFFAGASADGQVVSLVTSSQLVPTDGDDANDFYTARVAGGLAEQFPTTPSECSGEDCLLFPSGAPAPAPAGSAAVNGSNSVRPSKSHKKHHTRKRRHHKRSKRRKHESRNQRQRPRQAHGK